MNYEGIVTSAEPMLWKFELDNEISVYVGHLAITQAQTHIKFPKVGGKVEIQNGHFKVSQECNLQELFLCKSSRLICNNISELGNRQFLKLIQEYNLGLEDLLLISKNITTVEKFILPLVHGTMISLFSLILGVLVSKCSQNEVYKCYNNVIKASLKTISYCKYITDNLEEIVGFTFGIHQKDYLSDILIGLLRVNKSFGLVFLCDNKYRIACIITNGDNLEKSNILNKLVLIRKYYVFTETYHEKEVFSLEYIYFDVKDVIYLDVTLNKFYQGLSVETCSNEMSYRYNFKFKLLSKSKISLSDNETQYWLEVTLMENDRIRHVCLGLNFNYIYLIPFLKEGELYKVDHNKCLKVSVNWKLLKIKSFSSCLILDEPNAVFTHEKTCSTKISILNINEAFEHTNRDKCISFQSLLSRKIFTRPKFPNKKVSIPAFGTPGSNTHTLIFEDDIGEHRRTLFLNDWEKSQIPLGLIPGMRICVRNVLQKDNYFKTCDLTSLEVLNYEPQICFETVNLNADNIKNDKYSFLGYGRLLPPNVIIWGRVFQVLIRSLKITAICINCKQISTHCYCGFNECCINIMTTLIVVDKIGQALIISKNSELVQILLGLAYQQWQLVCKVFEEFGQYIYKPYNLNAIDLEEDAEETILCKALNTRVKVTNTIKIFNLDLKCRNMDCSNNESSKWLGLDVRRIG